MSLTNASPEQAASAARLASRKLAVLENSDRNDALTAIHDALLGAKATVLEANARDLEVANKAVTSGQLSQSLVKRLDLGKKGKYEDMLQGILDVRGLDDPLGKVDYRTLLDDGLVLERKSSPIGVLLIIFEARPEVIANIASLAIKSGNAAILKGGKESIESFKAIATIVSEALTKSKVPNDAIQLVQTRDAIAPLLKLDQYIDLVIPRGGNELVRSVKDGTTIPVMGHADGLCSTYLRADCETEMAVNILLDAKLSYPAACNSVETLLVDQDALESKFVPVAEALVAKGVELRCDELSKKALSKLSSEQLSKVKDATDEDYNTEYLDSILAVKTIPTQSSAETSLVLAVAHINAHSSGHTDAILTTNSGIAEQFLASVDSAGVFWNTSTRMADGQRFGFGTEVGISTNKIHARGPVGLEGLTIYRWLIRGSGQISTAYGSSGKQWKHERLPAGSDEWVAQDAEELKLLREHRSNKGLSNGH
ncbi:gamma-glutamyl phosphate reductase [Microthyrium microscopicum]|uniref:glutamate-5-semialdehyde dehydrogenase n=1 Tax=Microthyrium microscopicum TaxID=703497 RepID=A0A6A6TZC1_9PEZI|nr:gamma-glutamyl phosphate reductase [Microthyrium microscopicum]